MVIVYKIAPTSNSNYIRSITKLQYVFLWFSFSDQNRVRLSSFSYMFPLILKESIYDFYSHALQLVSRRVATVNCGIG